MTSSIQNSNLPEWDLHKVKIDKDGVQDFFWPIAFGEVADFNKKSIDYFSSVIKRAEEKLTYDDLAPYRALGKYYLCEIAGIYRALLLQKRCDEFDIKPEPPSDWLFCPYVWEGERPECIQYYEMFRNDVRRSSVFRFWSYTRRAFNLLKKFKSMRGALSIDNLKLLPITKDRLDNSIIVTQRTFLISQHAALEDKETVFCRSNRWYRGISDQDVKQSLQKKNKDLEQEIFSFFEEICCEKQIQIPENIQLYLKDFIAYNAACLRVHYNRLFEGTMNLPKHLWTGTAGNVWDLLLRLAVIRKGGVVEAHDHGTASGLTATYAIPFIEMWACTRFYTYTETHADLLRNLFVNSSALEKKVPQILGLGREKDDTQHKESAKDFKKIKKIMIISTIYDRDRGRPGEVPAEIVKADFQARLISYLVSKGYEVVFKAHPESPSQPPKAFEFLGAAINNDKLEEVIGQVDLLLYDYVYTSTFREGLETDLPAVILDTENIPWDGDAKNLLNKRTVLVSGGQDKDNRFTIGWDDLDRAIEEAPKRANDKEFYKTYF